MNKSPMGLRAESNEEELEVKCAGNPARSTLGASWVSLLVFGLVVVARLEI